MVQTADLTCDFCDGTGCWADTGSGLGDLCFVCDGVGSIVPEVGDDQAAWEWPRSRGELDLLVTVSGLSQTERQRLYEELHRRWNCRIYKS